MKKFFLISVISFVLPQFIYAGDGSPLSGRGIGGFTSFASSRAVGMGNAGLALLGGNNLNIVNPASWTGLGYVTFNANYIFSGDWSDDKSVGSSSYLTNGNFGGASLGLPLQKDIGLVFAAGFTPFSNHDYQTMGSVAATNDMPAWTLHLTGSGGLGEGFVGFSLKPFKWLDVGTAFRYAFGRVQTTRQITFNNSSYYNTYSDRSVYLRGPSATFGMIIENAGDIFNSTATRDINIGGYVRLATNLHGNYHLKNSYIDHLDTTLVDEAITGYVPPEFGIGVTKVFREGLTGVLDVRVQKLSKYYDSFTPQGTFGDKVFVGAGLELFQGYRSLSPFDKRAYRVGAYYEKSQFLVMSNGGVMKQADEIFLTGGVELPISYAATVNFSLQYGLRGLGSDLLLKEKVLRFYLSITGGETWFFRPESD
ncbi:MAG: hypothetical protein ACP5US_11035 [Candidatus Kryptoniota bacterium]